MKNYTTRQNSSDVKRQLFMFIGYFIVLSLISFLPIYLFFRSYTFQRESIQNDVAAYKEILNKQQMLKSKIDTLHYQMSLFNTGKVQNDAFLGGYISENIMDTRKLIDKDSVSEFKHYSFLLNKMDTILVLKNEIISIADKEQLALKDLNDCIGKIGKVKTELKKDPTRGFQSK